MKQTLAAITLLLAVTSVLAFGQTKEKSLDPKRAAEQELKTLDEEYWSALTRHDAEALDRLLASDFTLLESPGELVGKAGQIAKAKSAAAEDSGAYKLEDVSASVTGGLATVSGRAVFKLMFEKQKITRRYWYSHTFAMREGRWQIVAAQITSLTEGERLTAPTRP